METNVIQFVWKYLELLTPGERMKDMKESIRVLVGLLCVLALLSGCCGEQNSAASLPTFTEETVKNIGSNEVEVHTVQELIDAIAPNTTILLPTGTLMLNDDVSLHRQNPYCKWEYDTLVISNVDNLTIRGSGKDLSVVKTGMRYAHVLSFRNCRNLTLSGFTAGHTQRAEACEGNVLQLEACSDVVLSELGLFGCGAVGLHGFNLRELTVTDTDLYDCSVSGASLYQCGGVRMEKCRFFDVGVESGGASAAAEVSGSMDVTFENCRFENNACYNLITNYASEVTLRGCSAKGNKLTGGVLNVNGEGMGDWTRGILTLDGITFENNSGWSWLEERIGGSVLDETGEELTEEDLNARFGAFVQEAVEAPQGDAGSQRDQITVKNADEFLAAIGPDREIIVDCPLIDLSTASTYGTVSGEYYRWEDPYDGPQLVIQNVTNLTIRGKDGKDVNVISTVPRYAYVLAFEGCRNITVRDLTVGHTKEPGYCMGGVLQFQNCGGVTVAHTGLFGCGTIGVDAWNSTGLLIQENDIYECSYGGINLFQVDGISMEGNTFRALAKEYGGGYIFSTDTACKNVLFNGQQVRPGVTMPCDAYADYIP